MNTRARLFTLLVSAAILFAVGGWLRLEAHALCTQFYHLPGTSGTELNASSTDEYRAGALVEVARVLLCLGSVLGVVVAAAWIFLPDFRFPGYMDLTKNWPSGPGFSPNDPNFPV